MVSKKEKEQMSRFITNTLEDSEGYNIEASGVDGVRVKEKIDYAGFRGRKQRMIEIVTLNYKWKIENFNSRLRSLWDQGIYSAVAFYKDEKNFHVRLGSSARVRENKSLKHYSDDQLNSMLHLRGLEKRTLDIFGKMDLAFYQPKTERLNESIRIYCLNDVELDYSHLEPGDRGYDFVQNTTSLDYKVAIEREKIEDKACFFFFKESSPITKRASIHKMVED